MKIKISALFIAVLLLLCTGCVEDSKKNENEIKSLKKSIKFLKANKACLEDSIEKLSQQLTATKYQITSLEGRLDSLTQTDQQLTFWETFHWSNWQVNFVLLLLFVLWLLYRTQIHKKQ